jgi:phage/plasmid-associated DNA primase
MSVFNAATDSKFAGCAVVFAFEAMGDLELDDQVLTDEETKAMTVVAAIAAESCGHSGLTYGEFGEKYAAWQQWLSQNGSVEKVIGSMITAGNTLKANWKDQKRKKDFLNALMILGASDDTVTDNEKRMVLHVAALIDGTDALMEIFEG